VLTSAWHAAVDALIVYGALCAVLTVVFFALVARETRRARREREARQRMAVALLVAQAEALLRDPGGA